jgi:hypothetical protein
MFLKPRLRSVPLILYRLLNLKSKSNFLTFLQQYRQSKRWPGTWSSRITLLNLLKRLVNRGKGFCEIISRTKEMFSFPTHASFLAKLKFLEMKHYLIHLSICPPLDTDVG